MNELLAMRENRAKLWETMKNFLDTHKDSKGLMNAEDSATYDKMEKDLDSYGEQINRLENAARIENEMARPAQKPLIGAGVDMGAKKTGVASDEYDKAMMRALRSNFRQIDNVLREGVDADGGYLVPEEMEKKIVEALNDNNIMRRLGTVIRTSGDHKINIAATTPAAAWLDEGEALTFGDATFSQKVLDAHKLAVAIKVTEELMYDSAFNLRAYIVNKFGMALANAEESAFMSGAGPKTSSSETTYRSRPTGVFASGTQMSTVAKLAADNIIEQVYALKRPYRKNACFIMNDATVAAVRKLKDTTGQYMWQPSYQAGEPDRLLGYRLETSQYAPEKKIAFGDFSYYTIGDRGTRSFQELRELFAGNGMVGFVAKERVDGQLVLAEAVQVMPITAF